MAPPGQPDGGEDDVSRGLVHPTAAVELKISHPTPVQTLGEHRTRASTPKSDINNDKRFYPQWRGHLWW